MPPHSKNTGNTPNNSGNGRNQQDGNRDYRHDQGQPPEMIQMMQTLVGVVQQQVNTGDNVALILYVTTQGKVLATSALYLKRTSHN